jgi:hypothetical protein
MIDVDDVLRAQLPLLYAHDAQPDWDAVVAGVGVPRGRARKRATAGALVLAFALAVGLATPLGSAVARGLDGFSAWLTGEPGKPASRAEQQSFARANALSYVSFPKDTKLRQLITQHTGAWTIQLLGFRSGTGSLCLRLVVHGPAGTATVHCAPLADLRLAGAPARVMLVDDSVGSGPKYAWYGIDRLHSAALQITVGVAADNVQSIVLRDQQGRHVVPARSNAFLYVAQQPEIGQRVRAVYARTATGLVAVPFSPSPFGFGFGGGTSPQRAPTVRVERKVVGGTIGWLDRREQRGQPLSTLPPRLRGSMLGSRLGRIVFGRVLTPDPSAPYRMALTLNSHRRGGPAAGLCTMIVGPNEAGGGCSPYPGVFDHSPLTVGWSGDGAGEFVTISGVAADSVARLQVVLVNKERLDVPLADNAYVVGASRADLPARVVALDRDGKVIGVSGPIDDFTTAGPGPARGRAVELLHVTGPKGEHAELFVGASTNGGECMYVKHFVTVHVAGAMEGCQGPAWTGPPLRLSTDLNFLSGRVRSDVATVRLNFATGPAQILHPTRGYVLAALPAGRKVVSADGLSSSGHVAGHMSFAPPKRG